MVAQKPSSPPARAAAELETTLDDARTLRDTMLAAACQSPIEAEHIHESYTESARNLLAYLALRRHDVRSLQMRLARLGLSSLGRSEAYTLSALNTVVAVLQRLAGGEEDSVPTESLDMMRGEQLLQAHAKALFGAPPVERGVRIMVTMPSEAANDYSLVHDLLAAGMDSMRINCAHDGPETWLKMIEHVRRAEKALEQQCRVMMDLAGPKLRTGQIEPGPAVVKVKPTRDMLGRVTQPARVWLSAKEAPATPPSEADADLQVPQEWLARLEIGDTLGFIDARDSQRQLEIVDTTRSGCWAELYKTAYITPGLVLHVENRKGRGEAKIADFPPREQALVLNEGDTLILMQDSQKGRPATYDRNGRLLTPATIGCTLPEVFNDVRAGEPIWFDDGKIGGVIDALDSGTLRVRITHAPGGAKLRSDKGINFPQSNLQLDALTPQDLEALAFAAQHADVVEMSFVNTAEDVKSLLHHLERLNASHLGVVLKIETRRGFENLPALLFAGMRLPRFGVMIARGDLAVESGFERLAELQEEILCLCEAAHVPVIWATQVLETLAKKGAPSRAEITDAAMGVRAECVMLNKGPHILKAVNTLGDLLRRMQAHHSKKRDLLKKLHVAQQPMLADHCPEPDTK
ncbi:pyruvate kinase [Pseudomonas duriflava]|uniref:pyruvate kinase n=1 Tax=Pseudomonas duriflava TaxID=459528 RepID=A0A562QDV7_9PSED|nr:pyruvate kinase [Pseudomonas duriflava]TWI54955.1 pyruvate kinase [Pseudomonas duriflava]